MIQQVIPKNSIIAASAMLHLKSPPLSTLAEDTEIAIDARGAYPRAIAYVLERGDWACASTLAELPEITVLGVNDPELQHGFSLPAECVRLREVKTDCVRHRLDGRILRSDTPGPLLIRFTRILNNEADMTADLVEAIALRMAWAMAGRWGQDDGLKARLARDLEAHLNGAKQPERGSASPRPYDNHARGDWASGAIL